MLAVELLEASTPEACLMSENVLGSFLESFPNNKLLRHWLHWWHDRRRNIFRAFTGHDHPRCNQAELVHASWKNRDETGLSLYQAAELTLMTLYYQKQTLWKLCILLKVKDVVLH